MNTIMPTEGYVTTGADGANGHTRYYARLGAWSGPFRATRARAQRDLEPKWKVLDEGGQIHVGLVTADGTVVERISGPSGPTRYGRRANALAAARAQNNR